VTTTTTTTTYAPIQLPPLPQPSSPKDPKQYPLLNATLPQSLRNFPLVFPGGARAVFHDSHTDGEEIAEEPQLTSGQGWSMVLPETTTTTQVVGLTEALERYGKKRSNEEAMQGIEDTVDYDDERHALHRHKRRRAAPLPHISTTNGAAPPSPLPSPHGSPPPEPAALPSAPPSGSVSPSSQAPLQPDLSLTTLLTLPAMAEHFSGLPPQLQSHVLLTFMRQSSLPVLRTMNEVLTRVLSRDFLTMLPPELVSIILTHMSYPTLSIASCVSRAWREIIDCDPVPWRDSMQNAGLWFGRGSEEAFTEATHARRRRELVEGSAEGSSLPKPHPFKVLLKSRHLTRHRWVNNIEPKHISFHAHGNSVVTCLIFSHNRIISASDDHSIHVYSPETGEQLMSLEGHEGGVWALAAAQDILVSGSTDRSVRIWDLSTGKCTHVFSGHTSTVRCLAIVKPEWVEYENENGVTEKGKWPKRPLIVTGSRDHSLRVWTLPMPGDPEYRSYHAEDNDAANEVCPTIILRRPSVMTSILGTCL
jgi:F-box and WD-40 domain protein CDC4